MLQPYLNPVIEELDPEAQHRLTHTLLSLIESSPNQVSLLARLRQQAQRFTDPRLTVSIGGLTLENPLLVGAGWDKTGQAVQALYQLGFAGVEVGTVVARPQIGNAKPRHFWLAPGVALNRYGFNSPGMEVVAQNLERYQNSGIAIGISLGQNKEVSPQDAPQAYAAVAQRLYQPGAFFVINVSSPNTPGLRLLQGKAALIAIIQAVQHTMETLGGRKPLFAKIAPELSISAIDEIIQAAVEQGLTGIIATNTSSDPDLKAAYGEHWRAESGGLSGDDAAFRQRTTTIVKHLYRAAGKQLTIIAAGGIKDTQTALEKIKAGATAVQIVTALSQEGPALPGNINRGIARYLEHEGLHSLAELRGIESQEQ